MDYADYRLSHDPIVFETLYQFVKDLKRTQDVSLTTDNVKKACLDADTDPATRALVIIGIAQGQWRYDRVSSDVLEQIRRDYQDDVELSRWRTEDQGRRQLLYGRRKASTKAFLSRIERANPRPRRMPQIVVCRARFNVHDCLAVRLSNGRYGAAIVLKSDESDPEVGRNLIGVLDYMARKKPTARVFRKRRWLRWVEQPSIWLDVAWYPPFCFRRNRGRFEVVAKTHRAQNDPVAASWEQSWDFLGESVIWRRKAMRAPSALLRRSALAMWILLVVLFEVLFVIPEMIQSGQEDPVSGLLLAGIVGLGFLAGWLIYKRRPVPLSVSGPAAISPGSRGGTEPRTARAQGTLRQDL